MFKIIFEFHFGFLIWFLNSFLDISTAAAATVLRFDSRTYFLTFNKFRRVFVSRFLKFLVNSAALGEFRIYFTLIEMDATMRLVKIIVWNFKGRSSFRMVDPHSEIYENIEYVWIDMDNWDAFWKKIQVAQVESNRDYQNRTWCLQYHSWSVVDCQTNL